MRTRGSALVLVDAPQVRERLEGLAASLGGACVVLGDVAAESTWAEAMPRIARRLPLIGVLCPAAARLREQRPACGLDRCEDQMLIDHLVYAAPDRAAAVAGLQERSGVRAQAAGQHLGLGTHNALLALGARTYLEIIAPDPGQPQPPVPRPFGVDGVSRGGLVSWALACDDIDAAIARARRHGYDPGQAADGQRLGPTGTVLRWRLTLNATAS